MDQIAKEWRTSLLEVIEDGDMANIPNLLSGGVDSATLLAAQMELGGKPLCVTFTIGGRLHDDAKMALRMADRYELDIDIVKLDPSKAALVSDIRRVMKIRKTAKKASIQCSQPIMHIADRLKDLGFDRAMVGTGAVCLDDKRVAILVSQQGEEAAREYRRSKLEDRYTDCGTGHMHGIARDLGVCLEEPYSDEPLRSFALALDFAELNRGPEGPKQKGIAIRAFPEFWSTPGFWRRNSPLQVNSGIREWHDQLLDDPAFNTRGLKSVVGIYNDMIAGKV